MCHAVLNELMTARSDNMVSKRQLITNLRENGTSNLPETDSSGGTAKLFKIMMIGQGLFI